MNKHTPSPWIHRTRLDNGANIGCKNGYAICDIAYSYSNLPKEELDANAALISAAPDLLDSVQKLLSALENYDPDTGKGERRLNAAANIAHDAIAKATAQ